MRSGDRRLALGRVSIIEEWEHHQASTMMPPGRRSLVKGTSGQHLFRAMIPGTAPSQDQVTLGLPSPVSGLAITDDAAARCW